jgi:hypothetical protein
MDDFLPAFKEKPIWKDDIFRKFFYQVISGWSGVLVRPTASFIYNQARLLLKKNI